MNNDVYIRAGGKMSARQFNGIPLQQLINKYVRENLTSEATPLPRGHVMRVPPRRPIRHAAYKVVVYVTDVGSKTMYLGILVSQARQNQEIETWRRDMASLCPKERSRPLGVLARVLRACFHSAPRQQLETVGAPALGQATRK